MSSIDVQFIEFVVKSLVNNPDDVKIDRRIDEKGVLLELTVNPEDLGRVIGKRGATAQSIRTLLRALGTKNDARYNLKIIDNGTYESKNRRYDEPASESTTEESHPETPDSDSSSDTDDEKPAEVPSEEPMSTPEPAKEEPEEEDRISKARKELEELDDLDV